MSDQNAQDLEIDFRAVRVETFSAAVLHAFGCPTAEVVARRIAVPAALPDFGVAVLGGIGVTENGTAHTLRCRSAWTLQPVQPDEVARISRRRCAIACGGDGAVLVISGPPQFIDDVRRLTAHLDTALHDYPPIEDQGVHAERRAVRFGRAVTSALHQFSDHATVPANLATVLDRCDSWVQARVADARHLLHRDGLHRLAAEWEQELKAWQGHDAPNVQRRVAQQLSEANATIPGGDADHIVCLFRGVPAEVAAALDAAPMSALHSAPHWGYETAIAVLPRPVAVSLYVHSALQGNLQAQPLVYAETVQKDRADLAALCGTALDLWDGGATVPPQMAWHAALAAAR